MHATLRKAMLAGMFGRRGDGIDGRSRLGKRFQALVSAHLDGLDHDPNEAELELIKTCAAQRISLETLERETLANGKPLNGSHNSLSRALERNLKTLRTRPVAASTPATSLQPGRNEPVASSQ